MSAALWRICRHIIGRLTIRDYIYQVVAWCPWYCVISSCSIFQFGSDEKPTARNDFSSNRIVKNTLRIDSKQRLHVSAEIMELIWKNVWRCKWLHFQIFLLAKRDEQNGAISLTQIIFLEKMNICYLTESLVIENIRSSSKVNYFIWMLFLFCENVACWMLGLMLC